MLTCDWGLSAKCHYYVSTKYIVLKWGQYFVCGYYYLEEFSGVIKLANQS